MIEVLDLKSEDTFGYRVDGAIEKADMEMAYDEIENKMTGSKKLNFYMEVKDLHITEISGEAVKEEFRRLFRHPSIMLNVSKGALVTDISWLRTAFELEAALIPTFTGKSFAIGEESLALEWLKTDQRAGKRLDITVDELVETSVLKVAGGFALGLLVAGLLDNKQRKAVSFGVLAGTVLAGLPLAIKVLNNNRQLLSD